MKKTFLFVGSVIILVLAAVTFIFIPALAPSGAGKPPVFGTYNGKPIELTQGSEFANAVANYTESYRSYIRSQGRELNDYDYFSIYSYAFNAAVTTLAYRDAVKQSGWKPTEQAVARHIVQLPAFFENGRFSARLYNALPASDRSALKKDIANQLIWARFSDDLFGASDTDAIGNRIVVKLGDNTLFGLKTAAAETAFLAEKGAQKRSFNLAAFSTADYPDSEVVAYGEEHSDLFTRYDLSVITTSEEAEAKKLLAQFKDEELAFDADTVAAYSEKYYSGADGKVTAAYKYQLKTAIPSDADLEHVLALKEGELSDVIKTGNGYSIFRADGDAVLPVFTEVAGDGETSNDSLAVARTYIKTNESGMIEDYYLGIARNFAASAAANGFEAACDDFGTECIEVPAITLNYGNTSVYDSMPTDIAQLSGAATNDNFLKTAFSLKNGEVSEPLVLGGNVLVLKLTGEQTDSMNDDDKADMVERFAEYDQSAAQSALFSSDKVVNNVYSAFDKYFMSR